MPDSLPYYDSKELAIIFNYKTTVTAVAAIKKGHFPVPTYKIGTRHAADKEVVKEFFRERREEGLKRVEEQSFAEYRRNRPAHLQQDGFIMDSVPPGILPDE